jgi:hypothetical protein
MKIVNIAGLLQKITPACIAGVRAKMYKQLVIALILIHDVLVLHSYGISS